VEGGIFVIIEYIYVNHTVDPVAEINEPPIVLSVIHWIWYHT